MTTHLNNKIGKKAFWLLSGVTLLLSSCTENVDMSARYVFKEQTVSDYLKKHPETYSDYVDLLYHTTPSKMTKTTVGQLLTARGHYTVFAPTNEALQTYLDTLYASPKTDFMTAPSWNAFTDSLKLDSIRRVLVLNSIIDSGDNDACYYTYDFPEMDGAEFPLENMYGNKISTYWGEAGNDAVAVAKDCHVHERNRNIPATNGVIHQVDKVIALSDYTASKYLADVIERNTRGYLVMAKAIRACGLLDTLDAVMDMRYENLYQSGLLPETVELQGYSYYMTPHRKFGFTIFAETDDFWEQQGIDPDSPDLPAQLQNWVADNHLYSEVDRFVTDANYKSEENLLNQWVTYHILPMRLAADKLVTHANEQGHYYWNPSALGIPVEEFYVPLGKRRLLKIYESKESNGVYLNRCPNLNNGRHENGHERSCDDDKVGVRVNREDNRAVLSEVVNACIYPLNTALSYTDDVRSNLKRRRIRMDAPSWFPEMMTNDIRKKQSFDDRNQFVAFPPCNVFQYFDNMTVNDGIPMGYLNNLECGYCEMNEDEFKTMGRYEITIKLPPVPQSGIYEIRSYYHATAAKIRGIAQITFGSDPDYLTPLDIPTSWEISPHDAITGWEADTGDDEYDAMVDKRMRNKGFMKGDNSYAVSGSNYTDRVHDWSIRRIIGRTFIDSEKTYYIRFKTVLDDDAKSFYLDYMEYCPKEVYDNPNEPEDIW